MKNLSSGFNNFRNAVMGKDLATAEKLIDSLIQQPNGVTRLQKICRTAMTKLYEHENLTQGEEAGKFATWIETHITPLLEPSPHPSTAAAMSIFLDPSSPIRIKKAQGI